MKNLVDICESILDQDYVDVIDDVNIAPEFVVWTINIFKNIKWVPDEFDGHYLAEDFDKASNAINKYCVDIKKKGKEWSTPRRSTESAYEYKKKDVTIICIQYPEAGKFTVGIGNTAQMDAFSISYGSGRKFGKFGNQIKMYHVKSNNRVWGTIAGQNTPQKKEYYVFPGHYYNLIRDHILP